VRAGKDGQPQSQVFSYEYDAAVGDAIEGKQTASPRPTQAGATGSMQGLPPTTAQTTLRQQRTQRQQRQGRRQRNTAHGAAQSGRNGRATTRRAGLFSGWSSSQSTRPSSYSRTCECRGSTWTGKRGCTTTRSGTTTRTWGQGGLGTIQDAQRPKTSKNIAASAGQISARGQKHPNSPATPAASKPDAHHGAALQSQAQHSAQASGVCAAATARAPP